jgi:hypothetical protein
MTKTEELKYLVQLQSAALDWRLSENDDRDPIRLEVEQRIAKLLGEEPVVIDGREQNVRRTEQMQKARRKYQENKVRVGKTWYPRELVEKQMLGPNKFKWVLKPTAVSEPPEDEHQCLSY